MLKKWLSVNVRPLKENNAINSLLYKLSVRIFLDLRQIFRFYAKKLRKDLAVIEILITFALAFRETTRRAIKKEFFERIT